MLNSYIDRFTKFCGILVLGLLLAKPAFATQTQYMVLGNAHAPIEVHFNNGQVRHPANLTLNLFFDQSQIIGTYDDKGTASTQDDTFSMTGLLNASITFTPNAGVGVSNHVTNYLTIAGDFQLDINALFTNPEADFTTGADHFGFDQQNVGTAEVLNYPIDLNSRSFLGTTATMMAKQDQDFAFRVFRNSDGSIGGIGWLAFMNGWLGDGIEFSATARAEFGSRNPVANWEFRLEQMGGTEIPEPMSAGLLALGLLGGGFVRRRKAKS